MRTYYFASPLSTEEQRAENLKWEERLNAFDFKIFLPQRDTGLDENQERMRETCAKDLIAVHETNGFFINLDAYDIGCGIELGYAHAIGKRCIGVSTNQVHVNEEIGFKLEAGLPIPDLIKPLLKNDMLMVLDEVWLF